MVPEWAPDAGDIVWMTFDPQAGHEQAGIRPALVLSVRAYNLRSGLMLCCPMTTQIKDYPFQVLIAGNPPHAVIADQVRSLDWRARGATLRGRVPASVLAETRRIVRALVGK